jgi:prenyltransferase beta subunit
MQTILELWDEQTAHLINTYANAPAALAVVAATIREHRRDAVANWILLRSAPSGDAKETVADGEALAHLAMDATKQPASPNSA